MLRPRVNLTLQEIEMVPKSQLAPYHREKCENWLELVDDNFCLNVDGHAYNGWLPPAESLDFDLAAWCYVSKECKDLNGGQEIADKVDSSGKALPRRVSAKLCERGADRLLRDLPIGELQSHTAQLRKQYPSQTEILMLGFVVLEAYKALVPKFPEHLWGSIAPVWRQAARAQDALPVTLVQAMKDEEPLVIYVGSGANHYNYKVVVGKKVYSLDVVNKRTLFGLLPTRELACPDTVHCLYEYKNDEL